MSCNSSDIEALQSIFQETGVISDKNFISKGCNIKYKTCHDCTWGTWEIGGSYSFFNNYLSDLKISGYNITQFPSGLSKIKKLDLLNLGFNKISSIPIYENLKSITSLNLSVNNFKGSLPKELNNYNNLGYINLQANYLDNIQKDSFNNLKNLTQLDLNFNNFTGYLPLEINQFKNLNELDMGVNNLTNIYEKGYDNLKGCSMNLTMNCISFTENSANKFMNNFSTYNLDQNCILPNQYGLKGITYKNCISCNNCKGVKAKQLEIQTININGSSLQIDYGMVSKDICP
jgi:Leucine-rich repeat (LRR) protein